MRFIKDLIPYVVIVVIVVLFRTFIATPVIVSGSSMDPTLKNGQILILNKLDHHYNRGDIVVITANINGKKERIVKRVMGLPSETIEMKKHRLHINDKIIRDEFASITSDFELRKIGSDEYFVMGDNRNNSLDSRDYRVGLINKKDIIGKPIIRIWPITKIGTI